MDDGTVLCVPRGLRDTEPGVFHVYTHSIRETEAFRDDVDRVIFLRELAHAKTKVRWRCLAFCLMTTHYHLLLDVDEGALPVGMQALNFRYAAAFNARHRTRGHVFGGRYDARRINDDFHLLTAYRYVVLNPVKARLCTSAAEWPWSSYAGTIGSTVQNAFVEAESVLDCFGGADDNALVRLRAFVEAP